MPVESLNSLKAAFLRWRRNKRFKTERVPESLIHRARRGAVVHGVAKVARATRLGPDRIASAAPVRRRPLRVAPAFSRVEVPIPQTQGAVPLAEAEAPTGLRLRVFTMTAETVQLLSAFCRTGGEQ